MTNTRKRTKAIAGAGSTNTYPIYGTAGEDLKLQVQNHEIYTYYFERLVNLALSQFEWHGLPESMDRRYFEKTLLNNGSALLYRPIVGGVELDSWIGTGWVQDGGQFDIYGYPRKVQGVDFNGRQIDTNDWYLIYDNNSRTPLLPQIDLYARMLWETHNTFRVNLMHQNKPYIIRTTKAELLTVKNIFRRMFNFDNVIEIANSFNPEDVTTIDTRVDFKGKELLETRRELWKDALSMLGITSETTKKERLIEDEITVNRQEDTVALNSRLLNRIELANEFNEKHGTNITVNIAEQAVSVSDLTDTDASEASENNEEI